MELSKVDEGWSKWRGKAEELKFRACVGFVRENGPIPSCAVLWAQDGVAEYPCKRLLSSFSALLFSSFPKLVSNN